MEPALIAPFASRSSVLVYETEDCEDRAARFVPCYKFLKLVRFHAINFILRIETLLLFRDLMKKKLSWLWETPELSQSNYSEKALCPHTAQERVLPDG
jgi:hypothetical protein